MKLNVRPLLRLVCQRFLGDFNGFVDMLAEHIPSPVDNAKTKVRESFVFSEKTPLKIVLNEIKGGSDLESFFFPDKIPF
jgi:hypothetical protein